VACGEGCGAGVASVTRVAKPTLVSVITSGRYVGCLLSRGVQGTEAFDSCERSLGIFADSKLAHEAVLRSRAA
jgi:hypothetical protein